MIAPVRLLSCPHCPCGPRSGRQESQGSGSLRHVEKVFQHHAAANAISRATTAEVRCARRAPDGLVRGTEGKATLGLPCANCHPSQSTGQYGPMRHQRAALGAADSDHKRQWIGLPAAPCAMIKDKKSNGDRI